jgi:hypothetical protein
VQANVASSRVDKTQVGHANELIITASPSQKILAPN